MSESTDNFDTFSDFIVKMRRRKGLTQGKFGEEIGVTKQTISHWENDRGAAKNETLVKLAEKTGFSVDFIAKLKYSEQPNVSESPILPGRFTVPLVSLAAAGRGKSYEDICSQFEKMVDTNCPDKNAFALRIEGDSMKPRFQSGEEIVVNPNGDLVEGKPVFLKDTQGRVYFKIYRLTGRDEVTLESLNPEESEVEPGKKKYKDLVFKIDEVEWIYPAWGRFEQF